MNPSRFIAALDFKALKSFDWRSLQKFANPRVADDLNRFLEKLPQNAGKTVLVAAGIAWAAAGAIGLYTTVQIQKMTDLQAKLEEAEAIKPLVPVITETAVKAEDVRSFVDKAKKIYTGLEISGRDNTVQVTAKSTGAFGQFREAIGHVLNGGTGWRVSIESLCIGRECKPNPLSASFKINKVSVDKPT
ncbi:MAG: hypothetical protein L6Q57_04275 [Alphaproteobacteria bacterium]|nr:hypothetical protein [Alphaproteobacteria bacterium]